MPSTYDNLSALPRGPLFEARVRETMTAANYGTEWCLTDIVRMDAPQRLPILDALCGLEGGKSNPMSRSQVPIRLRSVDGKPFTFQRAWPVRPPPANMVDEKGRKHNRGRDWGLIPITIPARVSLSICAEAPEESAVWLLTKYGWEASEETTRYVTRGIRERVGSRWVTTGDEQIDQWGLVEEAFEQMHPELAPGAIDTTEPDKQVEYVQAAAPAPTNGKSAEIEALREAVKDEIDRMRREHAAEIAELKTAAKTRKPRRKVVRRKKAKTPDPVSAEPA